jgi:hypothetical protein
MLEMSPWKTMDFTMTKWWFHGELTMEHDDLKIKNYGMGILW